jgi:hypothetical protein
VVAEHEDAASGTRTPGAPGGQACLRAGLAEGLLVVLEDVGLVELDGRSLPAGCTVTRPFVQHDTRSPGTPMTRLMKSFSPGAPTPTALLTARQDALDAVRRRGDLVLRREESRPLKTTTSPRWMSRKS